MGPSARRRGPGGRNASSAISGLTTISVFIESLKKRDDALKGASSMGAVNAYGLMLGGYQVTAVGEVPKITVEKVARSVAGR